MIRRLSLCLTIALVVGCAAKVKPPTAVLTVVGDATSFVTGATVQLDASKSTDPQNLPLTFRWFLRTIPAGSTAKLNATDVISPSFMADITGDYEIAVVVSDGIYSSGVVSLIVTAEPCGGHSPQVSKITFTQGTSVAATLFDVASDDAGVDAGPADGGSTDSDGGGVDAGPVDGGTTTTTDAGTTTRDAGQGALFRELDTVTLSAAIVDPDTDPKSCTPAAPAVFTYQWSLQAPEGSQAVLSDSKAESPTFTPDVTGNYIAAVQATDLSGRTGPVVSTVVNVADCGEHAPALQVSSPTTQTKVTVNGTLIGTNAAALNTPVGLKATATDLDNGLGPVSHVNCNPTGKNVQQSEINWTFITLPFGSHATITSDLSPSVSGEPVSSNAWFIPDVLGTYYIRVTAKDSTDRAADPVTVVINVGGCAGTHAPTAGIRPVDVNDLPILSGNENVTTVGQAVKLVGLPGDADNSAACMATGPAQTFTYQWSMTSVPAGSRAQLNSTTAPAPSFVTDILGNYTFSLVVTDSTGLPSLPANVTVKAQTSSNVCGARPPTITGGGTTNLTWNQLAQVQANSSLVTLGNPSCNPNNGCFALFQVEDVDNGNCVQGLGINFHWSFDSLPNGSHAAFFNPDIQNPSFVPDVANADYIVRLTATDTRGLSASATAKLHTQSQGSNAPTVQISSVVSSLAFSSGTPPTLSGGMVGTAVPLNLKACANNNTQPQVTDVDNSSSLCSTNPGPQTFSYQWSIVSAPAGSSAAILNPTTVAPSIVPDVEGTYRLRVVVTDSTGLSSAPADIQVVVGTSCRDVKPELNAIQLTPSGTAVVGVAEQLGITVSNVDPNTGVYTNTSGGTRLCSAQEQFTYTWYFVSRPTGSQATFNDSSTRTPFFVPDLASGTWNIGVTVTDSEGRSASKTITVLTNTCGTQPPVIDNATAQANLNTYGGLLNQADPTVTWKGDGSVQSGTAAFQLNQPINFISPIAHDPDNSCGAPTQTLTYTWSLQSLPPGATANLITSGQTASLVPDVPSGLNGSALKADYVIALTATDSTGRSTTQTFPFSVSNCGSFFPTVTGVSVTNQNPLGPTVAFVTSLQVSAGADQNQSSCLPSNFRLPGNAPVQYSWAFSTLPAGSNAVLAGADGTLASFTPDVSGKEFDITVIATDALGLSSLPFTKAVNVR